MSFLRLIATVTLATTFSAHAVAQTAKSQADVVVGPFIVNNDKDDALRAASESCSARLAAALTAKGVAVARDPQLTEKNLKAASAPWALLGRLDRKEGQFQLELRLMEVKSGEELRSYFGADKDPQAVCTTAEKAAERVAAFVKEQKSSP
jgi:hypothetical protein